MFRRLLAALIAISLTGVAYAKPAITGDESIVVVNGIIIQGAYECNELWLERDGVKKSAQNAHAVMVKSLTEDRARELLARGIEDFDNSVRHLGKKAACHKVNQLIDSQVAE